ncbi:hypothetical protein B0H10DRAFT_2049855 [Mycena sp. CBHHK59/15]|nr:hypothetical protein B0H10DRAFT_2049855 [Mycena sp. CBHHK59/15]
MPPPKRPDPKTDPTGWNTSWERDLVQTYGADGCRIPSLRKPTNFNPNEGTKLSIVTMTKEICRLQTDLISLAAEKIATDEFDAKWRSLTRNQREAVVLDALVRTTHVGPDMERLRKYCPEMTLSFLAGGCGEGLLGLINKLIPQSLEVTEPIYIAHKGVIQMGRIYYLSLSMWYILLTFYGVKEEIVKGKGPRVADNSEPLTENIRGFKKMQKEYKAERAEAVNGCWGCGKPEPPNVKFLACSRCRSIGRWIRYCSPECQRRDWNTGVSHPHKIICGKELTESVIRSVPGSETGPGNMDIIPTPASSFQRRPALLQQAMHLQRPPFSDYMLVYEDSQTPIFLSEESDRLFFLVMRWRALKTGDRKAVCQMFRRLVSEINGDDASNERLKKQLENEFGCNIDSSDIDVTPPSKQELERASKAIALISRTNAESAEERIPKPDPGFKRRPALFHQIALINKPPFPDYFIRLPAPYPDIGIELPIERARFLAMRRRAFRSGDKGAVSTMFALLSPLAKRQKPAPNLKKQLEDEYGLGSVVGGIMLSATEEELRAEQMMILNDREK